MSNKNLECVPELEAGRRAYQEYINEIHEEEERNRKISNLEFKINELEKRVEYLEYLVDQKVNQEESDLPSDHIKIELTEGETKLPF